MEKEHDKIGTRLELIITKLNNGERFTAEELADEFNVNVRTIQRDLNKRLSYIPLQKEQNYYFLSPHALGKLSYKDIQNFAQISGINDIFFIIKMIYLTFYMSIFFEIKYIISITINTSFNFMIVEKFFFLLTI